MKPEDLVPCNCALKSSLASEPHITANKVKKMAHHHCLGATAKSVKGARSGTTVYK